jgi:hypothetical protein
MGAISDEEARARSDGRRIAHVIVISIAVAFVGASAAQIIPVVFGIGVQPIAAAEQSSAGSSERACAYGIYAFALGLDRINLQAWRERSLPEWDSASNIERACAQSRAGVDAWAALLRLRRAEEDVVLRGLADLAPLRRDVEARLPAELR